MRDDLNQLPLPPEAKRYARGKGLRFLRNKPQSYIDMVAAVTGQQALKKGFRNRDVGERTEGGPVRETAVKLVNLYLHGG